MALAFATGTYEDPKVDQSIKDTIGIAKSFLDAKAESVTRDLLELADSMYQSKLGDDFEAKGANIDGRLRKLFSPYGYSVQIRPDHAMGYSGLFLAAVSVEEIRYFSLNSKGVVSGTKAEEVIAVQYLSNPDFYSPMTTQTGGWSSTQSNTISITKRSLVLEVQANEKKISQFGWEAKQWKELGLELNEEEKLDLNQRLIVYHELIHGWEDELEGVKKGYEDFKAVSGFKPVEEPAFYGSVAFAEKPEHTLLWMLVKYTKYNESSGKREFYQEKDFASHEQLGPLAYSKGIQKLCMALAEAYGVAVPNKIEDLNNTGWIEPLFEKIRESSADPKARAAILRTQVSLAYQRRYGRALTPLVQVTPIKIERFISNNYSTQPILDPASKSRGSYVRFKVAENLESLAKSYQGIIDDPSSVFAYSAAQFLFGVVKDGDGAVPDPFPKPFKEAEIRDTLAKYGFSEREARFANLIIENAAMKHPELVDSYLTGDNANEILLTFVNVLRAMAQEIRDPAVEQVIKGY